MGAHDVFLSHSSDDAASARELRGVLEAAGYSCWMAPDDVTSTSSWAEQILAAIDSCRAMIVLISASANSSEHVSREVNLARARNRPVLPIRIEPVGAGGALEYFLSLVQRIDAFPPPIANHAATILARVERMLPAEKPKRRTTRKKPDSEEATAPERVTPKPMPGPDGRFAAGTRIGAFTIESVLGEGGMATVYRARQDEPNRAIALKVIRADRAADATYRSRFLAEKDTLAQLEHPSIVPIYAAGEAGGVLYIAMRLVDGPDLGARLKADGPMSVRETAVLLRPIADAVDHAHESGVLHRDLKPSNILIDRAGRPYLTDFGLGKVVGTDLGLSTPGTLIGTLAYVAPEQLTGSGDPAQAVRADIYALGCVAFACLTGRPPFDASNLDQTVYAITQGPRPRATAIRPELPRAVDAVLDRALSRDPSERPPDARALITDLVNVADAEDGRTTPIPRPTHRPLLDRFVGLARANPTGAAIAAALAVVLVGGVTFAALGGFGPGASPTPGPTATGPITNPGPSGGSISLVGDPELDVATDLDIEVEIEAPASDPDGICAIAISNDADRPLETSALWTAYDAVRTTFDHTLEDGDAGTRTVYAWFRDCLGNPSALATSATIVFDHPPVARNPTIWFEHDYCTGDHEFDLLASEPYAVTDEDGMDTIRVVRAWTGGPDYDGAGVTKLDSTISADGKYMNVTFTGNGQGDVSVTDYITVEDDFGLQVTTTFEVRLTGC